MIFWKARGTRALNKVQTGHHLQQSKPMPTPIGCILHPAAHALSPSPADCSARARTHGATCLLSVPPCLLRLTNPPTYMCRHEMSRLGRIWPSPCLPMPCMRGSRLQVWTGCACRVMQPLPACTPQLPSDDIALHCLFSSPLTAAQSRAAIAALLLGCRNARVPSPERSAWSTQRQSCRAPPCL